MQVVRLKKNIKRGVCAVAFCRRRTHVKNKLCPRCSSRRYAETNPVNNTFLKLKHNAARRGKEFTLTLEEFRIWCVLTDYISLKGKYKGCMTIDRIRSAEGYHLGNIQIMLQEDNSSKGNRDQFEDPDEDLPF